VDRITSQKLERSSHAPKLSTRSFVRASLKVDATRGFHVLTFVGRALKMKPTIAKTAESGAPEQI
jgi:hypothetical protein